MTSKPKKTGPAAHRDLRGDLRGAVQAEYVVLLGSVSLAAVAALLVVGPNLVRNYERTRNIIVSPFP